MDLVNLPQCSCPNSSVSLFPVFVFYLDTEVVSLTWFLCAVGFSVHTSLFNKHLLESSKILRDTNKQIKDYPHMLPAQLGEGKRVGLSKRIPGVDWPSGFWIKGALHWVVRCWPDGCVKWMSKRNGGKNFPYENIKIIFLIVHLGAANCREL